MKSIKNPTPRLPRSTEKLVAALLEAKAPQWFVEMAQKNEFHDFLTTRAMPMHDLVFHAQTCGLDTIAEAARRGDFDAGPDDGWKTPKAEPEKPRPVTSDPWTCVCGAINGLSVCHRCGIPLAASLKEKKRIASARGTIDAKGFGAFAREYDHRGTIITREEAFDLVKKWREHWPEIADLFREAKP